MMKKLLTTLSLAYALSAFAAPAVDSPLWQTWDNSSPMLQEWKKIVASEAWKGNKIGIDHDVPPPWTPMTVENTKINMWGRSWDFDGKALPQTITSQGEELLASPLRFVALVDGKWVTSTPGTGKIVSSFPDQVIYEGETEVAGVKIKTRFTLEFDGFVWMEYFISRGKNIPRLALEFPIRREVAQFFRKQSEGLTAKAVRDRWGKITVNRQLGPLKPYFAKDFCFANDKIGIDFATEGVAGWYAKDFKRRVEWLVSDTEVIARFNFIDNPPNNRFPKTKIEFGCNIMPYRPLDRNLQGKFMFSWDASGQMLKEIMESPSPTVRMISPYYYGWEVAAKRTHFGDACAPCAIPIPRNPERMMKYMRELREQKPGSHIVYYAVGDLHTDYDPVFIDNAAAWKGADDKLDLETVCAFLNKKRGEIRRVCGWNQDYIDYKVYCFAYWAEKLGLDGFYWDDQNFMPCINPDHPEHRFYDCNGKMLEWKPIRNYREMTKRIYKAVKKHNPNAVFVGHTMPPHSPFSELSIDGEVLRKLSGDKQYYTRFVEPEDCRNVYFNSHVDGSAKLFLPEYYGRFYTGKEAPEATRAMLAFLWMTDLSVWIGQCDDMTLMNGFIHPRGAFGVHEAEYLAYYNQEAVNVDNEKVFCTVFRKKDKVLIAVSNLNREAVSDTVNIDMMMLFPGVSTGTLYNMKAFDGEKHTPVKMELVPAQAACFAEIKVEIPAEDFVLLEIKKTL
ncbi:MAG: hypothetical protein IKD23_00970 [Lentisphaeria bacterium]|nr:hypothetical protein [Lentisphaeria bacterium]